MSSGEKYPNTLAAACDPITQTADIEVYVSNDSILYSSTRGQCGDPGPGSCSYAYKIPCSTAVMCDGVRRLEDDVGDIVPDADIVDEDADIEQGFMTEEMKAAAEPSDDSEDTPYCVHEDYPCKGNEEKMVYVCHYSSRSGYQSFCVPELDSDILRFNKKHHCGSCDGWNGVEHTGQVIL